MEGLLNELDLPATLRARVNITRAAFAPKPTFVLYLPLVVLRAKHNPGLALAARLANHLGLPLIILSVLPDDAHLPGPFPRPVVSTARRLAFTLQAHQAAAPAWAATGAAVLLRAHGPAARAPDHCSLAARAAATVLDEPFVRPYTRVAAAAEAAAAAACVRVDGSTTVPPAAVLTRAPGPGPPRYRGVPAKAWMWEKATAGRRRAQVAGAVEAGDFDAPALRLRCPRDARAVDGNPVAPFLPRRWAEEGAQAPGERAWTLPELEAVVAEEWVQEWPGVDLSVPVCTQTHGGGGEERWARFSSKALASYATRRNNATQPHAVSRMSCYLNLGTVSIFEIVHALWSDSRSTAKFEDEIIKWREMSYAHAFSTEEYFAPTAVPVWARAHLERKLVEGGGDGGVGGGKYCLEDLAGARTGDSTWNAMQSYLNQTGELHNNVRMTWGKTIVEWQAALPVGELLHQMSYCNDRYALDGLSPPSYAGLLWCLGWCDKPGAGGKISTKPASRYRVHKDGFEVARQRLLESDAEAGRPVGKLSLTPSPVKRKTEGDGGSVGVAGKRAKKSIASYFSPK